MNKPSRHILKTPAPRRMMHKRNVRCDGYIRDDGLWEVDVALQDKKPFSYIHFERGEVAPGDAVHEMNLRLTVDDNFVIVAAEGAMSTVPMQSCRSALLVVDRLVGVVLKSGWEGEVRKRIGRLESCVHLMDLIKPAVTTLYQTTGMGKSPEGSQDFSNAYTQSSSPFFLNGCYSWRSDGDAAQKYFPQFSKASSDR